MIYLPHTKDILLYIIMPFPSPPPPCIIYPPGIALGPSIQFLLMKHPSHFDLVRDLWLCYFTVHFCVVNTLIVLEFELPADALN